LHGIDHLKKRSLALIAKHGGALFGP